MAKKDGRMKAKCEAYRRSGRREINKDLRAKRHLARVEHFAKRKEEGKTYEYKPPKNKEEVKQRALKNVSKKLPIQRWTSLFAKADYQLEQEELRNKEKKRKGKR